MRSKFYGSAHDHRNTTQLIFHKRKVVPAPIGQRSLLTSAFGQRQRLRIPESYDVTRDFTHEQLRGDQLAGASLESLDRVERVPRRPEGSADLIVTGHCRPRAPRRSA
jgi:hypothetical protein